MKCFAIALLAVSFGCNGSLYRRPEPVEGPDEIETPRETKIDPVEVQWSGDPRIAFGAALRSVAGMGFDVTVSNADAGVLKVDHVAIDQAATDSVEVGRLRIWNGLTSYQQSLAIRSGRSSDVLLEPATISRRLMLTIVTTPETVVVTPVVE